MINGLSQLTKTVSVSLIDRLWVCRLKNYHCPVVKNPCRTFHANKGGGLPGSRLAWFSEEYDWYSEDVESHVELLLLFM